MRLTCLLAVSLVCALYISQVSGTCICGALSEDYCTCRGLRQNPKILIGSQHLYAAPQASRNCQCGGNHIVEPYISHPQTYVKSFPVSVVYTTPLCPACTPYGRPVCSDCVSNCKPLCSKCALFGKPVCSACVGSLGSPKVYTLTEEQSEFLNPSPAAQPSQKTLSVSSLPPASPSTSSSSSDLSEQASNPSAIYSIATNGKDFIEVTETKSNLTSAQLMGLRKFFGNTQSNNSQQSKAAASLSSLGSMKSSVMNNEFQVNTIDKQDNEENLSNSDETKPSQTLYISYSGFGPMPDKITKLFAFPSLDDQNTKASTTTTTALSSSFISSSDEGSDNPYKRTSSGSFLDFFRL